MYHARRLVIPLDYKISKHVPMMHDVWCVIHDTWCMMNEFWRQDDWTCLQHHDLVCMILYLWFCSPEGWLIYKHDIWSNIHNTRCMIQFTRCLILRFKHKIIARDTRYNIVRAAGARQHREGQREFGRGCKQVIITKSNASDPPRKNTISFWRECWREWRVFSAGSSQIWQHRWSTSAQRVCCWNWLSARLPPQCCICKLTLPWGP